MRGQSRTSSSGPEDRPQVGLLWGPLPGLFGSLGSCSDHSAIIPQALGVVHMGTGWWGRQDCVRPGRRATVRGLHTRVKHTRASSLGARGTRL